METIQNNERPNQSPLPEPRVSGVYGHGWQTMKKYFPELLLVMIVQMLLSAPMGFTGIIFGIDDSEPMTVGFFNFIYAILIVMPVSFGASWVYLKASRGDSFRVQDIFFAYQSFGQILLANILIGLIVGAGFILLIVPGIIFACKLAFVPYLVMDEKMEAVDAIRKSWNMTRGHTGTIFLMGLMGFLIALGGLICFVIGIFPASIWISLAFATIYMAVAVPGAKAEV